MPHYMIEWVQRFRNHVRELGEFTNEIAFVKVENDTDETGGILIGSPTFGLIGERAACHERSVLLRVTFLRRERPELLARHRERDWDVDDLLNKLAEVGDVETVDFSC